MMERSYWQHAGTGEIWAVETDAESPVRCSGPLAVRDIHALLLDHLLYSSSYVSDLRTDWVSYSRMRLCPLCNRALPPGAAAVSHNGDAAVHLSCSLNPPPIGGQSVGAAVFVEALWQASARLRREGAALRRHSGRILLRCQDLRARHMVEVIAVTR
jgi:hypothetical protein